jgi:flagellin
MISFQTNVDSLIAQQNLRVNSQFQSKTIQQLTSGYRINSSGDDAAGLAVANSYRNSIAQLTQGVRNANDGVSQLQIIDGGLSNISQILDRLTTLATESASDTFTGDRATLDKEFQSLLAEIDRQANDIGLGATNTTNIKTLKVYIGGGQDANTDSAVSVDLTNSGVGSADLGLNGASILTAGKVTIGSQAAAAIAQGATETFTIGTGSGEKVITLTGRTGDTVAGQVQELNAQLAVYGISASLDATGTLQMQSANAFTVAVGGDGLAADGDSALNTGLKNATYTSGVAETLNITVGQTTASIALAGTEDQDTAAQMINAALQAAGISGITAVKDETDAAGKNVTLESATPFSATHGAGNTALTVNDATSLGDPSAAINAVAAAVKTLGFISGKVGTGENTLNYAINLAQSQISSFSSAESQIRDTDVAAQAANLTKAQVLQQSSIAAMAQANAEPQAVLALLKQ